LRTPPEKIQKRKGKFLLGSAQEVSGRSGGATNARGQGVEGFKGRKRLARSPVR